MEVSFCDGCTHLNRLKNCDLIGLSPKNVSNCTCKLTKEMVADMQKQKELKNGKSKSKKTRG